MAKCLLVGNGINLLSGEPPSWIDILKELAKTNQVTIAFENKPYTLIYEEISLIAYHANKKKGLRPYNAVN